jgi:hypothetical protein
MQEDDDVLTSVMRSVRLSEPAMHGVDRDRDRDRAMRDIHGDGERERERDRDRWIRSDDYVDQSAGVHVRPRTVLGTLFKERMGEFDGEALCYDPVTDTNGVFYMKDGCTCGAHLISIQL